MAVCDTDAKAVQLLKERYPVQKHYLDMDDMLKSENLDIVDITTPGFMHYAQASQAIERRVNVLIEKPLALSSEEAYDLNTRSKKNAVQVCVVQNYRFRDASIQLEKLRSTGKIGRISSINTYQHGGTLFGQPRWMWDERVSGGILYENAVHAVDFNTWLVGPHKRILACSSCYDDSLGLTTSIQALVEHESNATSFLDLRWFASSIFYKSDIFASVSDVVVKFQPDSLVLQAGELGPLTDTISDIRRVYTFGKSLLMNRFARDSIEPHLRIISGFVDSVKAGGSGPVTIEDVMPTMRLLDAIKNASRASTSRRATSGKP